MILLTMVPMIMLVLPSGTGWQTAWEETVTVVMMSLILIFSMILPGPWIMMALGDQHLDPIGWVLQEHLSLRPLGTTRTVLTMMGMERVMVPL